MKTLELLTRRQGVRSAVVMSAAMVALSLPVLAIGGAKGIGEGTASTMKLVADDVQSMIVPGSGHWVAEEAPEQLLSAITGFLAPYRSSSR